MEITKIGGRGVMFTFFPLGHWRLNCYCIFGDVNNYLIDTACGGIDAKLMLDYINSHSQSKPLYVINTHHHWDHIWGNGSIDNCTLVANTCCYELSERYWRIMLDENAEYVNGEVVKRLPDITFDKELRFNQDNITLIHSVGHTEDGIIIYDGVDKILYAGDNVGDSVDQPVPYLESGKDQYKEALRNMLSLDFDTLASGHNVILDKSFIHKIIASL